MSARTSPRILRPISITLDDIEPEDVIFYSRLLGIDLQRHRQLLWLILAGLLSPLPEDWIACEDRKGRVFYHNVATSISTWTNPVDVELQEIVRRIQQRYKNRTNMDLIPEEVEEDSVAEIDFKDSDVSVSEVDDVELPVSGEKTTHKNEESLQKKTALESEATTSQNTKSQNNDLPPPEYYEDDFEQITTEEVQDVEPVLHKMEANHDEILETIEQRIRAVESNLTAEMRHVSEKLERSIEKVAEETKLSFSANNTASSDAKARVDSENLHKQINNIAALLETIQTNLHTDKQTAKNDKVSEIEETQRRLEDEQTRQEFRNLNANISQTVRMSQAILDSVCTGNQTLTEQSQNMQRQSQTLLATFADQSQQLQRQQYEHSTRTFETLSNKITEQLSTLLTKNDAFFQELHSVKQQQQQSKEVIELDSTKLVHELQEAKMFKNLDTKLGKMDARIDRITESLSNIETNQSQNVQSQNPTPAIIRQSEETQTEQFQSGAPIEKPMTEKLKRCIQELSSALAENDKVSSTRGRTDNSSSSSPSQQTLVPVVWDSDKQSKHRYTKRAHSRPRQSRAKTHQESDNDYSLQMNQIHRRSKSLVSLIHETNQQLVSELVNIRKLKKFDQLKLSKSQNNLSFVMRAAPSVGANSHYLNSTVKHSDSSALLDNLRGLRARVNDRIDRLSESIEKQKITQI